MKAHVHTPVTEPSLPPHETGDGDAPRQENIRARSPFLAARLKDYLALSKPRVTSLVMMSFAAGMVLGGWAVPSGSSLSLWLIALAGSWLVIAAANALNQVFEREFDAKMRRTAGRPLPSGRLGPSEGLAVAVVWAVLGLTLLALFVNLLTAALGAASILIYAFAYTPLKRRTHMCTVVGAIPGAIPPLAGWAAARNEIGLAAVLLFAIQFIWQFPHFWAIAWLYRDDLQAAGFRMLPFPAAPFNAGQERSTASQRGCGPSDRLDYPAGLSSAANGGNRPADVASRADGNATGLLALQYSLALLPLTAAFGILVSSPALYVLGALLLGGWMVRAAGRFWRAPTDVNARRLLKTSVIYLPLLLLLAVATW
ncbi:MAG: protoheme IX farnesyltransferase [Armatimonadetes bacterium]|nr:protoheme IX farnesyltransferase [Armatimonadota bacterium]